MGTAIALLAFAAPAAAVEPDGTRQPMPLFLLDAAPGTPAAFWVDLGWMGAPPGQSMTLSDGRRVRDPGWLWNEWAMSGGLRLGRRLAAGAGFRASAAWLGAGLLLAEAGGWSAAGAVAVETGPGLAVGLLSRRPLELPAPWSLSLLGAAQWSTARRRLRFIDEASPGLDAYNAVVVREQDLVAGVGVAAGRGGLELTVAAGWRQPLDDRVIEEERPSAWSRRAGPWLQAALRLRLPMASRVSP